MRDMDYYALLKVEPSAETATIRLAYHALARRHHPDHAWGSNAAMARLNAAWAVLRDESTRAGYDVEHGYAPKPAEATGSTPPNETAATPGQSTAPPAAKGDPDVLDFGRYTGWRLRDLVKRDPEYLLWLERTSIGRRYKGTIDALFSQASSPLGGPAARRTAHG